MDAPIEGLWTGTFDVLTLTFLVEFEMSESGLAATIDSSDLEIVSLALSNVSYESGVVHFELESNFGLAVWEGELRKGSISGKFEQGGFSDIFRMRRTEADPAGEPPPYLEEEVAFTNGDVTLTGTLTRPTSGAPHPAVVLISGSGPQDRDGQIFGFRMFEVIADHLTRGGIAVLRYDDRGVGGSGGVSIEATLQDRAGDVLAAVELLKGGEGVEPRQIGLLGHSEGAVAALIASSLSKDVAFVVMMGGPTVPLRDILLAQLELVMRAEGADEEEIQEALDSQARVIAAARTGRDWDEVEAIITQQLLDGLKELSEAQRDTITDVDAYVTAGLESQLAVLRSPWYRSFLDFDPGPDLRKTRVPLLAIYGELDAQVPAEMSSSAITLALTSAGNADFTVVTLPGANHLFQSAVTGSPSEYAAQDKDFVPGFLGMVTDWLLERVDVSTPES